ncbi:MAG: aminopeptidase P family protein [Thermoplasmata archaeon]|nr:MAG: aminopeptidase P family protein [Thermoplasmata archaeon]
MSILLPEKRSGPMNVSERIARLRELMKERGVQAYLVPSTDPHHSEYLPECWKRRQFISGFTGSAGDVVVTLNRAGLWTDGRYFLQAEDQLQGSGIDLFKMGLPETTKMEDWIVSQLPEGSSVGVDPRVLSVEAAGKLKKAFSEKDISLKYIDRNLVDVIWEDRPAPSDSPITVHPPEFSGETVEHKLERVREKLSSKGCSSHVLCALDTIAWVFDLRGKDIDYNPVFISYAVITEEDAHLFVDRGKVTEDVREHLANLVTFHPYEEISSFLKGLAEKGGRVWIDPVTTNKWLMLPLEGKVKIHMERSPITDLKSVKNRTELAGFRKCLATDGAAMVRFLKWLEEAVPSGGVTEISAALKLEGFRREGEGFVGLSFNTISAYGEHGAIIHYDPTPETDVELKPEGIYLVDSGGQYVNGTTDITRTVSLGEPNEEQREMFTRVLKGHIDLAMLRFPRGFSGKQIDAFARKALWDAGKNYGHGTGHGVGHYLNVHEGPMGITPRDKGVPLMEGNVLSNEPGYYKAGEYGIRTENLVVIEKDQELSSEELEFLKFETITLCPIDLRLVDEELLTEEERKWLNDYHRKVREELSPLLDEDHVRWLSERTRAV